MRVEIVQKAKGRCHLETVEALWTQAQLQSKSKILDSAIQSAEEALRRVEEGEQSREVTLRGHWEYLRLVFWWHVRETEPVLFNSDLFQGQEFR